MSTRIRPERVANKGPAALFVSRGEPADFCVVGEHDLRRWQDMAYHADEAAAEAQAVESARQEKREKSRALQQEWRDTIEGQVLEKERRRERRLADAESRRAAIDELEREFQKQLKERVRNEAAEKLFARDFRARALDSVVLHHHVIAEREQQEIFSARKKDFQRAQEEAHHEHLMSEVRREEQLEAEKVAAARIKAVEMREACRQQVEDIRTVRLQQRDAEREEARRLRELAEQEAEDNRAALTARRQQHQNLNSSRQKFVEDKALTPRPPTSDPAATAEFLRTKMAIQHVLEEERKRKQEAMERRTQLCQTHLAALPSPRKEALVESPTWAKAPSGADRMIQADSNRVANSKELAIHTFAQLEARAAEAARVRASQRASEAVFRKALDRCVEEAERDELAEKAAQRQQASEIERIWRLQQRAKERQERNYAEHELLSGRTQLQRTMDDNMAVKQEIVSRLPEDVHPALVKRVMAVL